MHVVLKDHYFSSQQEVFELDLRESPSGGSDIASGLCSSLAGESVGLFVHAEALYFLWNGQSYPISSGCRTCHTRDGAISKFSIDIAGEQLAVEYAPDTPVSTPFYTEVEEDADFGLWLHNVLSSSERTTHIVHFWRKGI
jgi:hypothetical protein